MADLFVISQDDNGACLELCYKLEMDKHGHLSHLVYENSHFNLKLTRSMTSPVKQKLFLFVLNELKAEDPWAFHKETKPALLFGCVKNYLQSRLPKRVRARLSNSSDIFDYIAYSNTKKSVRKALYRSYEQQMRTRQKYDPKADLIICRSFDDPNLIVTLLSSEIRHSLFADISIFNAILFLRWLQKYYLPTSIVNSIDRSISYSGCFYTPKWVNIIRMAETISNTVPHAFNTYFKRSKFNVDTLHDELIRINSLAHIDADNTRYIYSKDEHLLEGSFDTLSFVLPKDAVQLHLWGDILNNCLFAYETMIIQHETLIIGVFKNSELTYALEYDSGHVLQAYGKYNSKIDEKEMEKINRYLNIYPSLNAFKDVG